jgi:RNA polymerase sigma-70 factor (ECF subfamily)
VSDGNSPSTGSDDPADGALLAAHAGGSAEAFDRLVERHQGRLLRFATGLLRDRTRAEDVVQETFLRLLRKPPAVGSAAAAGPWLFRVCRNLAYDLMKTEAREQQRRDRLEAPASPTPDEHSADLEVRALVRKEWDRLPAREREALWLKVHDGLSYAQIGEVLGVKAGTVGWIVHEAMQRLTQRLRAAQAL